ncbi:MAG: DUF378 domain-containing protein [Parachlamydiales bacterium]|nr:DUF378 domain-containing protein [Parachlamydiales bacterium]
MKKLDVLALVLLIIGGLNWGIYGVFDFNFVDYFFGKIWIDRAIYFLVGVSAVYAIVAWKSFCKRCKVSK